MRICSNCGREIDDSVQVCVYCGHAFDQTVKESNEQVPDQETEGAKADSEVHENELEDEQITEPVSAPVTEMAADVPKTEGSFDNSQNGKKKKPMLYIGIGAAACVIIALVLLFALSGRKDSGLEPNKMVVLMDEEGNAYYSKKDTAVKVEGDFLKGYGTMDGKHLIALDENGDLYVYDGNGKNEEKISGKVSAIYDVRDKGVIFCKKQVTEAEVDDILKKLAEKVPKYTYAAYKAVFDETFPDKKVEEAKWFYELLVGSPYNEEITADQYFRYLFEEKETTELGTGKCSLAKHNLNLLFTDYENIYQLAENSTEKEKISSCNTDMEILLYGMSDSGRMGVWSEYDESETLFYVSEDVSKTKIGAVPANEVNIKFGECFFDKNDQQLIIFNYYTDKIFRKKWGEEAQAINAGGLIAGGIYSRDGQITDGAAELNEFYIRTLEDVSDQSGNLYYIDKNGEREKVLTDRKILAVANGRVYYVDEEDNLYQAEMDKDKVKNEVKITSDINEVDLSEDGAYIYFTKDPHDGNSTLYSCKTNQKSLEPEKIAEEVSFYRITADGKRVAYIKDAAEAKGTYTKYGDLYIKDIGKDSEKISSDAANIYSPYEKGYISDKYLNFIKYDSVYKDSKLIIGDYVYYNGKENQTIIKDIKY